MLNIDHFETITEEKPRKHHIIMTFKDPLAFVDDQVLSEKYILITMDNQPPV